MTDAVGVIPCGYPSGQAQDLPLLDTIYLSVHSVSRQIAPAIRLLIGPTKMTFDKGIVIYLSISMNKPQWFA